MRTIQGGKIASRTNTKIPTRKVHEIAFAFGTRKPCIGDIGTTPGTAEITGTSRGESMRTHHLMRRVLCVRCLSFCFLINGAVKKPSSEKLTLMQVPQNTRLQSQRHLPVGAYGQAMIKSTAVARCTNRSCEASPAHNSVFLEKPLAIPTGKFSLRVLVTHWFFWS